ncbi:MAG: UvrD-helicase domain-containing protein, partial [Candidatus Gastranaerophilales bacterium]|nr:UvrD-helicase domain-containing protein [Candidatus Gastranaerophilales bacterium]
MQINEIELNKEETEIYNCFKDINDLKSFFLFAGAGSGKTHSLVKILQKYKKEHGGDLKLVNKKIAVITYTNAACDEIKARLDYDDSFMVSTIHSFLWEVIKPYQKDIKEWVKTSLSKDIRALEEKINSTRNKNTKTYVENIKKLENKKSRMLAIKNIKVFSYEPNGVNIGKDCLNHAEIISMGANFILNKTLMQLILVQKYPILFIDESQDTNKNLIDAFF